jgi:hypothetical protein
LEFPDLEPVKVILGFSPEVREDKLGCIYPKWETGARQWIIEINTGVEWARKQCLQGNDDLLRHIVRHEMIHAELKRLGEAAGDKDINFIKECIFRRVRVENEGFILFEKIHGRKSFDLFWGYSWRLPMEGARTSTRLERVFGRTAMQWLWRKELELCAGFIRFCKPFGIKY